MNLIEAFVVTEFIEVFLGGTAISICDVFPKFRELTPSPSSGCAGSLVAQKLMTRCPTLRSVSPLSRSQSGL